jgi:hypothetical protein
MPTGASARPPSRRFFIGCCWTAKIDRLRTAIREGSSAAGTPVANVFKADIETRLAIAANHVAHGRAIVAQQRERVARLKAMGTRTREHERTLDVFISTLQILEEHERDLRNSVPKLTSPRGWLS